MGSEFDFDQLPLAVYYTAVEPTSLFAIADPVPSLRQAVELGGSGGRQLIVRRDRHGSQIVDRLLSTDLADYLDPRLQPGNTWPPPTIP